MPAIRVIDRLQDLADFQGPFQDGYVLKWDTTIEKFILAPGGDTYTNEQPVPAGLGGIEAGSTFDDVPVREMFDRLLYPYQLPAFTAFTMVQTSPLEVGATIGGVKSFTWSINNQTNVVVGSLNVVDATGNVILAAGLVGNGQQDLNVGTIQKTVPTTNTWSISATNSRNVVLSRSTTVTWLWRIYYGTSLLTALPDPTVMSSKPLASNSPGSYSFAGGGYKYLCVPTGFTAPSTFIDSATGLSVAMAAESDGAFFSQIANGIAYGIVSVTNQYGVATNYRIYRSKFVLGSPITITVN